MSTNSSQFPDTSAPAPRESFPTTHWSVVLHAGTGVDAESQAHAALETLCRQYWYPLYAFIRRQGRAHHEAEDCTQEFLARLLSNDGIARARPERGRFRTFLLTALRNFLIHEWHRAQAAKRGGGQAPLPLDFTVAETRYTHEPVDPGSTPEKMFDRQWAAGLIDEAVGRLREEYVKTGRGALFDALAPLVWGNTNPQSLSEQASRLGLSPSAFSVALHRLRQRLGERLRATVAETVATREEVDDELRYLIEAISGQSA